MASPWDYLTRPQIMAESGGDPNAVSPKGATGIMQVMPATARDPGFGLPNIFDLARQMGKRVPGNDPVTLQNLLRDPEVNQAFGVAYRDAMIQRQGGNVAEGLAAYNAGPGAVDRAGGVPNFPETQNYVARLMGDAQQPQPQPQGQPSQPPAMMQAQAAPMPGMAQGGLEQAAPQDDTPFWQSDKFGNILDSLAIGVNSLRMTPDANIAQAAQGRMAERKGKAATNKTVEFLRAQGRTDLADAVESGSLDAKSAVGIIYAKGGDGTGLQKEYAAAQGQGFGGTLLDYQQEVSSRTRAPQDESTSLQRNYQFMIDQGMTPEAALSAVRSGTNVTVGGDGETAFAKRAGQATAEQAALLVDGGMSASGNMALLDRLSETLGNAPQGLNGAFVQAAGRLGLKMEGASDVEAAQAILNRMVPAQRIPGSGTMSDADLALFKASLPQIMNTPGGNRQIIETIRGINQYAIEQGRIAQQRLTGQITQQEMYDAYAALQNPLAGISGAPPPMPGAGGADTPIPEGGYEVKRVIP
jgi:hypothetical protein